MQEAVISGINPGFPELSQSQGQVAHVLLTRSPLIRQASLPSPFDLHVLSTPPAFVLSQNQTLRQKRSSPTSQNQQATSHEEQHRPGINIAAAPTGVDTTTTINTNTHTRGQWHRQHQDTLLSSQETDAHLALNFRSLLGATHLIYPGFPSCQIGTWFDSLETFLPDLAFADFPSHQHTAHLEWCEQHAKLRRGLLPVAPRVRARRPAFPPPRGNKNLTGPCHLRQIVPGI